MYINFACPPMPHLIVSGISMFRVGDIHQKRTIPYAFDMIYVRCGKLYMEENDRKFEINPGQYLILTPNSTHSGYRCCDEETTFSWVHLYTEGNFSYSDSPEPVNKFSGGKYYVKDTFYISLPQYGTVRTELTRQFKGDLDQISQVRIDHYRGTKNFYSSTISQIEYQIRFLKILTLICDASKPLMAKSLAEDVYDYMNQYYKKPFSLKELAKQYAFHPAHIIRCVKREYGYTPVQLLLRIRIEKAKKLLQIKAESVGNIAQAVGFSDAAYFTKQFKKIAGLTPHEYRKEKEKI